MPKSLYCLIDLIPVGTCISKPVMWSEVKGFVRDSQRIRVAVIHRGLRHCGILSTLLDYKNERLLLRLLSGSGSFCTCGHNFQ